MASTSSSKTSGFQNLVLVSGSFFFKYRNALFPTLFAFLFLISRPAFFLGNPTLDKMVIVLGIVTALGGQIFRLAVIGYAYIKRGGREGKVYADHLVIRGFYAHTRNPMYVGNFMIAIGLSIIYGSPCVYFFVIPFFTFVYLSIVIAEETYLRRRFEAEYEAYEKKVNRFIPNFHGLGESLKEFKYDWKRALRKDYGTIFGVLFGIIFINLWKAYWIFGYEAKKGEIRTLSLFLIPIILFYATTRYLKLTKRLASPN